MEGAASSALSSWDRPGGCSVVASAGEATLLLLMNAVTN